MATFLEDGEFVKRQTWQASFAVEQAYDPASLRTRYTVTAIVDGPNDSGAPLTAQTEVLLNAEAFLEEEIQAVLEALRMILVERLHAVLTTEHFR